MRIHGSTLLSMWDMFSNLPQISKSMDNRKLQFLVEKTTEQIQIFNFFFLSKMIGIYLLKKSLISCILSKCIIQYSDFKKLCFQNPKK